MKSIKKLLVPVLSLCCICLLFSTMSWGQKYRIRWDPNSEPDLAGYKLYWGTRSRTYDSVVNVGYTTEYILDLPDSLTWFIAATAYDTARNESAFSNELRTDSVNTVINSVQIYFIRSKNDTLHVLDWDDNGVVDVRDWYESNQLYRKYWENRIE